MNDYLVETEARWRQRQLQKDLELSRLLREAGRGDSGTRRAALVVASLAPRVVARLRAAQLGARRWLFRGDTDGDWRPMAG